MGDWLITGNAAVWDVFEWWETTDEPLDRWTLSWPAPRVARGDRFALWIGGRDAGVYATGTIAKAPEKTKRERGGLWRRPPPDPVYEVRLTTDCYLFDRPIYKRDLLSDPAFQDALVVRMPRSRNPIPLTSEQWDAVARRLPSGAPRRRARTRPSAKAGIAVVSERPVGTKVEDGSYTTSEVVRVQRYSEFQLVKAYERFLQYPLVERAARLPNGERLVADAFDPRENRLIEAKASASRANVRMAIGQLLDYRRHLAPRAKLAVLLPEAPSSDLFDLLCSQRIEVVHRQGRKFVSAE